MQNFTVPPFLKAVALSALVALSACSQNGSPTPTPTPAATTYATTWTVGSKNYIATTSNGAVYNGSLTIGATQAVSSTESYSLTMVVPAATGTYAVGGTSVSIGAGYGSLLGSVNSNYVTAAGFGAGTITVATLSATEIMGTFSFTATDVATLTNTVAITNGKFLIKR